MQNSQLICLRQLFLLRASAEFGQARLCIRLGVGSQFFLCSHILIIVGWEGSHKGRPDNDDTL